MRSAIVAVIAFLVAVPVGAQTPPPGGSPVFHGVLEVLPAPGTIDRATGAAVLRLRRWRLQLVPTQDGVPGSNGIFPDRERVLITIGAGGQNDLYLPPGSLVAHRRGKVFTYRAPRGTLRGIRTIRITQVQKDPTTGLGSVYRVNATLVGVILTDLLYRTRPDCISLAIIVGDDDGFSGVQFVEPNLNGRQIAIARSCTSPWPWLGQ